MYMSLESTAIQTAVSTMAQRLGSSVVAELQPIIDAIAASPRGLDARELRLVIGTIQEKIGEPISVSMLSTIAGLSRSHFSHAFRTTVGRTPRAHIVRLRIERAMKLQLCRRDDDAPANPTRTR
jgi:transcriptional regulator GlxA family with amidase domain